MSASSSNALVTTLALPFEGFVNCPRVSATSGEGDHLATPESPSVSRLDEHCGIISSIPAERGDDLGVDWSLTRLFDVDLYVNEQRKFVYRPLTDPTKDMRLLRINDNDVLSGDLVHVSPESTPPYEALSYTWGTNIQDCRLLCSGGIEQGCIMITKDLRSALLRLKQRRSPLMLWIDQICIDQGNENEKDGQISRMWDIYLKCSRAIIWLGMNSPQTDLAMDAIEVLMGPNTTDLLMSKPYLTQSASENEDESEEGSFSGSNEFSHRTERSEIFLLREVIQQEKDVDMASFERQAEFGGHTTIPPWTFGRFIISQQAKEELDGFFLLPWFSRLWVVQEVTFAPEAVVMCGSRTLDWSTCSKAIHWLHVYATLPSPCSIVIARQWVYRRNSSRRGENEHPGDPSRHTEHPVATLEHTCCLYSSDSRDKYRALWGLLSQKKDLNAYKDPLERILMSWTFTLYGDSPLSILASAGTRNKEHSCFLVEGNSSTGSSQTWPSWAPDWNPDSILTRPRFPYGHMGSRFNASRGSEYRPMRGRNVTRQATTSLLTRGLSVKGKFVSHVNAIYRRYTPNSARRPEPSYFIQFPKAEAMQISSVISSWFQSVQNISQLITGEDLLPQFARMLVACADNFIAFEDLDSLARRLQSLFTFCKCQLESASYSFHFIEKREMLDYFFTLRTCSRGQRLFTLDDMSWGLCPPETLPGDILCIIYGANAPFVMRKYPDTDLGDGSYILIGDCYVEGIMNGEAMLREDLPEQLFYLV
jgi:hypothetical protein